MQEYFVHLLQLLSLPTYGLTTVFLMSFLAATILPLTPTPFVAGLIKLNPELFWPAILVAAVGNTFGGGLSWWMGVGAKNIHTRITHKKEYGKAMLWLEKFGPKVCLLAWVPVIGDPICIAAGWLRMSFWPCLTYMFIGRFGRFLFVAVAITLLWPGAYPL